VKLRPSGRGSSSAVSYSVAALSVAALDSPFLDGAARRLMWAATVEHEYGLDRVHSSPHSSAMFSQVSASAGRQTDSPWPSCDVDLPWNPARLEQRLGRIKRIGQLRDTVVDGHG
jgi:hypothetical protein